MKISINRKIIEIQQNLNLKELVETKHLPQEKGVAIAINKEIIVKTEWSNTILKENDDVQLFNAIQGG